VRFDLAPHPYFALAALALATPLGACTTAGTGGGAGDAGATAEVACDPLAPKAISLGMVVGVGKDASDTLYVDSSTGIFVSGGGKLLRQHLVGTGQSGTTDFNFNFETPADADPAKASVLLVETTGATASAMALGSNPKGFLNQADSGATPLTLVDPATVSSLELVNTPNVIEYIADVANGEVLVATLPMNEDSTSDDGGLSIFYGPPSAVAQRTITAFGQSLSNDGTLTFLVDGTPYVLAFGTELAGPDAGLGTFTLQGLTPQNGAPLATTLRSPTPTTLPTELSFSCLP
jgi:hypothetical protein